MIDEALNPLQASSHETTVLAYPQTLISWGDEKGASDRTLPERRTAR
jgi:hypothetical protein